MMSEGDKGRIRLIAYGIATVGGVWFIYMGSWQAFIALVLMMWADNVIRAYPRATEKTK